MPTVSGCGYRDVYERVASPTERAGLAADMTSIDIIKAPTSDPSDTAGPLQTLRQAGFRASDLLAVVGKTEGNG